MTDAVIAGRRYATVMVIGGAVATTGDVVTVAGLPTRDRRWTFMRHVEYHGREWVDVYDTVGGASRTVPVTAVTIPFVPTRCGGTTARGRRCSRRTVPGGDGMCRVHAAAGS